MRVNLAQFDNRDFDPGGSLLRRVGWYLINELIFNSGIPFGYSLKTWLLRAFGATVGVGLVIKPHVRIKFPWKLRVGDHVWLGEDVWIDNLDFVSIGSNSCVSQGALILCGNHDFSSVSFDLRVGPISIEEGAWLCSRSVVTQNVTIGTHAVLGVGSIASSDLDASGIYRGNPAIRVGTRYIDRK